MPNRHWIAASCYLLSAALDLIDGTIARLFNQSSKLGAILDTLADRCADMCLLSCLCTFYVDYMFVFMMIMLLDISSHWIHVHRYVDATPDIRTNQFFSYMADAGRSHKDIDPTCPYLLRLYYKNKMFLTVLSSSNETFFILLYLCHFTCGPKVAFGVHLFPLLAMITGPPTCLKIVINALQFWSAAKNCLWCPLVPASGYDNWTTDVFENRDQRPPVLECSQKAGHFGRSRKKTE
ncbi:hypothetical protein T265_12624, partial [Opisthorchis viverrini]